MQPPADCLDLGAIVSKHIARRESSVYHSFNALCTAWAKAMPVKLSSFEKRKVFLLNSEISRGSSSTCFFPEVSGMSFESQCMDKA